MKGTTTKIILVMGLVLAIAFGCLWIGYKLLTARQLQSITVLGWEGDRYLWMAGSLGTIRWDTERQAIVNRNFECDGIRGFFASSEGQVWAYGDSLWRLESGKCVEVKEVAGLKLSREWIPGGWILDMGQTAGGAIWIATWDGFKSWNQTSQQWTSMQVDLPGTTLVEGQDGSLWFGLFQDGVIRLQSGKMTHYTTTDGLANNRVESMLVARDGTIWVGTRRGASHWDGIAWQGWSSLGYPDPDGLLVEKFYETRDGTIWASTSEDLASWADGEWTAYPRSPACFRARTFLETSDGSIWAGCTHGLFRWTSSGWREYGASKREFDPSYIIQGTNGILYAIRGNGIYQYLPDRDRWQLILK